MQMLKSAFYVKDDEIAKVLSWDLCFSAVRETFREQAAGRVLLTNPRVQKLSLSAEAYRVKGVSFTDLGVAGLRAGGLIIFNHWPSMTPLGVVEERTNYAWRVGAVTAVSLEVLEQETFNSVCLFGAGRLARTTLAALSHRYKMDKVTVLSRSTASREALANHFQDKGLTIKAGDNPEQAVKGADLVITITTADEVLVRSEWVSDAATVVSMGGGQELDFNLFDRASAVFVDDLEGCLESGDLAAAQNAGRYQNTWIEGTLADLFSAKEQHKSYGTTRDRIVGKAVGPTILIPRGMAAMDVMQAYRVLGKLGYSFAVPGAPAKGKVG